MDYCSIDEAWKPKPLTQQFDNYKEKHLENNKNIIETFKPIKPIKNKNTYSCDRVMQHIYKCKKCQLKLIKKLKLDKPKPKSNDLIQQCKDFVNTKKDIIVIILIGIAIMLTINIIKDFTNKTNINNQQIGSGNPYMYPHSVFLPANMYKS